MRRPVFALPDPDATNNGTARGAIANLLQDGSLARRFHGGDKFCDLCVNNGGLRQWKQPKCRRELRGADTCDR